MTSTPDPPEKSRSASRRSTVLRIGGMVVFGVALLLLVMSMTILRNDSADSHPPMTSAAPVSPSYVADSLVEAISSTTSVSVADLSALEQAQAAGGYLTGASVVEELQIYEGASPDSKLMLTFPREGKKQISSTFLITAEDEDPEGRNWYEIRLPIRPNGSKGWVRAEDLSVATVMYSIAIDLSDHRLDLYEAGRPLKSYPVGVGTGDTPTPPGDYYITIKMQPTLPNSVYGVLAMGVSGFSDKLTDWPEGGQLGIHGTNDPSSVGKDVSHGCIRLYNEDILDLSPYVAYGTPVNIQK